MNEATVRYGLPYLVPGQAQKELWHNEALAAIDAALHPLVEGPALTVPPVEAAEGQCWLVAAGASGEWTDRDDCLAQRTESGWRFVAPVPGMTAWSKTEALWLHWTGGGWGGGELPCAGLTVGGQQVVGERQPAILNPSGGTIIDAEARASIEQIIAALMSHGLIE